MARDRRRRQGGVVAISVAAHLAVLAILAAQPTVLAPRLYSPAVTPVTIIPFYLVPPRSRSRAATAPRLHVRRPPVSDAPTAVAPLPIPPTRGSGGVGLSAGVGVEDHPGDHPPGSRAELGRALRWGGVHCGTDALPGLSQADRDLCAERFGAGAKFAQAQGAPIAADKRAYYDASLAARKSEGHGPGISCHILFGGGKPPSVKAPPHALKLGPLPCYAVPPAGLLTPEVDVPDPY